MWFHLYDAAGAWVGQFRSADMLNLYAADNSLDLNDYRIETGPSKYPSS